MSSRWRVPVVFIAVGAAVALGVSAPSTAGAPRTAGGAGATGGRALARSPQLSASTRLADRRFFVIGTRFYEGGAEDATYPAMGFHTRGEMGGFWSLPIKLLDGVWFGVNDNWLSASKYTSGWGYARMNLGTQDGVKITRTDVAPDGLRAGLIGLTLTSSAKRTITLKMDAHSELMSVYPWGDTKPSQTDANLQDTGAVNGNSLVFRDQGTPPVTNATKHNWAAVVGSSLTPFATDLGPNFRGPQSADVVCPPSSSSDPQPDRCDDTAYGKGTGGELQYHVNVPAGSKTIWFAVGGSDQGLQRAQAAQQAALAHPAALLAKKVSSRKAINADSVVHLPGDPQLAQSVAWSKQNLADARQEARNLKLRVTHAGTVYPKPSGTLKVAKWVGAGWPDYPWIFGTDGEYTTFAEVAAGQFTAIEDHLRTLKQISDKVNHRSGKVVHEAVADGSVYFGANGDDGNTDETVKFPSAVALVWRWTGDNKFRNQMYGFTVRNMKYVFKHLDTDHDGWLEGAGNVERTGMGDEKLDNTVYAIRGLLDLAEMAASKHDTKTLKWARSKAQNLQKRFEKAWWYGKSSKSYADSLQDPGNKQLFQRYWIGLTPVEAELPASGGTPAHPLAALGHARTTVKQHERACFTGKNGLYHTGTGKSSDATRGTTPPKCDKVTSAAPADREIFTLTTSIASVAEAALGRSQVRRYTDDLARVQLSPKVVEIPGDMPEISPSPKPDFGKNIDKLFTERSSGLQSWGSYGVLWPVVHFELGVAPDLGNHRVSVVPMIPAGQHRASGSHIRLGHGFVDVTAAHSGSKLTTSVLRAVDANLTVGTVLPKGAQVASVRLNGSPANYRVVSTARGREVLVNAHRAGSARLVVRVS
ncbi:MAG TPA: hypothetical protein VGH30_01045 [Jatrophihabitantaceae bacterium]